MTSRNRRFRRTGMQINADFSRRAVAHAADLDWVASPMAGVERKMLDRIGEEVARATSIVRYAPASHFSAHVHSGGEEFLVLDGVFQDEHGDFPAGSYVRNPPQSSHTPGSAAGCTILVKLWQFDPADRTPFKVDGNALDLAPLTGRPGVTAATLHEDSREHVRLEHWAPGAVIGHLPSGGIELFCLEGGFTEGGERFSPWSWLRLPVGATLRAVAGPEGCRLWVKEGHLRFAMAAPRSAA
jgi:anti-sigma factor ChrR (cupin superfamily)